MTILKRLVVKNGSYEDRDGKQRGRYVEVGHLHEAKDGGQYITLDAHINLAAFPRREGDTRVMVSMYDNEKKEEGRERPRQQERRPSRDFEDDVPW
ncbi:MAG: hypothetical protein E6Q97_29865 [Desulfurellales bacterium]|nr:MAG: hypothetical protein E6Q97_29865 [Desulfurellales bacterium]